MIMRMRVINKFSEEVDVLHCDYETADRLLKKSEHIGVPVNSKERRLFAYLVWRYWKNYDKKTTVTLKEVSNRWADCPFAKGELIKYLRLLNKRGVISCDIRGKNYTSYTYVVRNAHFS